MCDKNHTDNATDLKLFQDGISHTVEILDTAGSHHFPAMRELSIRSGRGFLLVYSVDSYQSFVEAMHLFQLIADIRGAHPVPVVVVGNKCDLELRRQVSFSSAEREVGEAAGAGGGGVRLFESSAKFDTNVREVFFELLQMARTLEEAQEQLLEEQDLYRRKSRRLSKRLSRKLSCFNHSNFALARKSNPPSPGTIEPTTAEEQQHKRILYKDNQRCVLI